MRRVALLLAVMAAAMAIVGLVLPGDGLLTENRRADAQTASRPNFVFVMTDDLDERSMQDLAGIRGIMGDNGTTFDNSYVTYSLCCPSRATYLRGQYPHNHDIIGNGLPEGGAVKFKDTGLDRSTFATWLKSAGYNTAHIGKYMNSYSSLYVPPGWDEWYTMMGDHWNLTDPAAGRINHNGQETTIGGHSTDVFSDKANAFIRANAAKPAPWFVHIGTKAPHSPPEVATRHQDKFQSTPLPQPPNFDEPDVSDKPAWIRQEGRLTAGSISNMEDTYRKRLRSMLSVEDLLRDTIATLQETGELDNTYIFFTSDNGYHMGHHRLGMGKKTPYEEDTGVPLIVRGPGVPAGAVRQHLVLNNDWAPTIADLAGATIPSFVDGSSFAPLLTSTPPASWRTAFLEEGWLEGGTTVQTPTHKSVHTLDHMFTEYVTGEYELYDLHLDPYQLESKPRAGSEQLYSELQARLNSLRDCSGAGCRNAEWDTGPTTPPPPPTDTSGPPTVISTVPGANATGVAPTANVTATFSEDMMASSINANTFKLF
jgi:N-acetylglucosamine-6-sulfatase